MTHPIPIERRPGFIGPHPEERLGYALCPLPPAVPNAIFVCPNFGCESFFWTDEKGECWYHLWCTEHGGECCDAVQRIVGPAEYARHKPGLRFVVH